MTKPTVPLTERPWLSVAEAAEVFGISVATIRRAVRNGSLPVTRPLGSSAIRIARSDLDDAFRRDAAA